MKNSHSSSGSSGASGSGPLGPTQSSGNAQQQHYCLRWNNHHHNFLGVLESVLSSQQHADVSLFCEGHVIRVHKLVLLASSSHFESILGALPSGQQPVIILDGTRYTDLRALVDYMYRGEVNIGQEQLSSLLKTAETLKIKGLADVGHKEDDRGGGDGRERSASSEAPCPERSSADSNPMADSLPPSKRSKGSPVEMGVPERDALDPIDLRDHPRESRIYPPNDARDHGREMRDPRDTLCDLPRDIPRDLAQYPLTSGSNGGSFHMPWSSNSQSHLTSASSLASARSLLYSSSLISRQSSKSPVPKNFSSASHFNHLGVPRPRSPLPSFDPAPGSSLQPPRTSPQSPAAPDHKPFPQMSMPFGLPFSLPILHESKKLLDRSSHKLLPSPYDPPRDELPPWVPPPCPPDSDPDREYRDKENGKWDKPGDRFLFSQVLPDSHLSVHGSGKDVAPPQSSPDKSCIFPKLMTDKDSMPHDDKRNEDDKFSSSDKDSFSPPDESNSFSSKTDCTPEGEAGEEDEDSSTGGSIPRCGIISSTGGPEQKSPISNANNRGPQNTSITPASTPSKQKSTEMVKCPYCPRSYRHQNNLRTHIRCFHKGVRIPCPICHRGFTRWFTVRCHIAREHQNFDFSRPENLPAHLRRALYPPFTE